MKRVTVGGNRLGSGAGMQVELPGYGSSNQDMGYTFKTSMAAGPIVPFMSEVCLPGDEWEIDLDMDCKTHPTLGPLFGRYKLQADVFGIPMQLYNSYLHNNMLNIGNNMSQARLPTISFIPVLTPANIQDIDNSQINPSCLMAYLGLRGFGRVVSATGTPTRFFNAIPVLAYYDIYKNYYANKAEEIGYIIDVNGFTASPTTVTNIKVYTNNTTGTQLQQLPVYPAANANPLAFAAGNFVEITYSGAAPDPQQIIINLVANGQVSFYNLVGGVVGGNGTTTLNGTVQFSRYGTDTPLSWNYSGVTSLMTRAPQLLSFPLDNIDAMRRAILAYQSTSVGYNINSLALPPYSRLTGSTAGTPNTLYSQLGLAIKTYQADMFNFWIKNTWIQAITTASSVSTLSGSFSMDTLNLAKKVYGILNRVALSGGSYHDWVDSVYGVSSMSKGETPIYLGGMSKTLAFQEVVSVAQAGNQPLGTLAGRGAITNPKGGKVYYQADQPSYLMGLVSITPIVAYSQGNKWDMQLVTFDDLHKPALDGIGYQPLTTEKLAWWDTTWNGSVWVTKSAGLQPAWIDYMSNVDRVFGNFAIATNEMFMVLNRRYAYNSGTGIADLTTYIDPSKFNFIFSQTGLDAQNFWMQIAVNARVRRKMSAKVMPQV